MYTIGPTSISDSHQHARAVIDIGSNSVRMVVYHAPVRVPLPMFNEKYYCGLGRGIATSGKLYPNGVVKARKALGRFMVMAQRLGIDDIDVIATAAIRDAEDGPAFVQEIETAFGLKIRVISGEVEAEYAALGVMASMHHPHGIVADLGGGSMELGKIDDHQISHTATTTLGALRLVDEANNDVEQMQAIINRYLAQVPWLQEAKAPVIYGVGGSFRTIAKTHIRQSGYPLSILHEYRLCTRTMDRIVRNLKSLTFKEIEDLPGVPAKRAMTMLPAAMILQRLLQVTQAEQVVFSVSGVREGLLYSQLDEERRLQDPLIASAIDLASLAGRKGNYAKELYAWMEPLFAQDNENKNRLRMALCILSELAWTIDPNYRSEWAYMRVMQSAIKGVTHRGRVTLATALYHRYQTKWKQQREETSLLDESDRLWAKCVGNAANLAFHLSGGKQGNLHHARLEVGSDGELRLELDEEAMPLRTDTVEKRLDGLGSTFNALSSFLI